MQLIHLKPPSSSVRILNFLTKTDRDYIPQTSTLVASLSEYAGKLSFDADIFYLVDDNLDVGFCALYVNTDNAYISSIGITSYAQNMGLGSRLLKAVIQYAKQVGKQSICLEVYENNPSALHLYKKHGFAIEKRHDGKSLLRLQL